eukprot:80340_1
MSIEHAEHSDEVILNWVLQILSERFHDGVIDDVRARLGPAISDSTSKALKCADVLYFMSQVDDGDLSKLRNNVSQFVKFLEPFANDCNPDLIQGFCDKFKTIALLYHPGILESDEKSESYVDFTKMIDLYFPQKDGKEESSLDPFAFPQELPQLTSTQQNELEVRDSLVDVRGSERDIGEMRRSHRWARLKEDLVKFVEEQKKSIEMLRPLSPGPPASESSSQSQSSFRPSGDSQQGGESSGSPMVRKKSKRKEGERKRKSAEKKADKKANNNRFIVDLTESGGDADSSEEHSPKRPKTSKPVPASEPSTSSSGLRRSSRIKSLPKKEHQDAPTSPPNDSELESDSDHPSQADTENGSESDIDVMLSNDPVNQLNARASSKSSARSDKKKKKKKKRVRPSPPPVKDPLPHALRVAERVRRAEFGPKQKRSSSSRRARVKPESSTSSRPRRRKHKQPRSAGDSDATESAGSAGSPRRAHKRRKGARPSRPGDSGGESSHSEDKRRNRYGRRPSRNFRSSDEGEELQWDSGSDAARDVLRRGARVFAKRERAEENQDSLPPRLESKPAAAPRQIPRFPVGRQGRFRPVRRRRVRFTVQEVNALKAGVEKYGVGNWADIIEDNELEFNEVRRNVDLKDKWRNMLSAGMV